VASSDPIWGFLTFENRTHISADHLRHRAAPGDLGASNMGCKHNTRIMDEPGVNLGFFFIDIEPCAPESLLVEGVHEGLFVDDGASGGVHDNGVLLDALEVVGVDEVAGLIGQWRVDRNDICGGESIF